MNKIKKKIDATAKSEAKLEAVMQAAEEQPELPLGVGVGVGGVGGIIVVDVGLSTQDQTGQLTSWKISVLQSFKLQGMLHWLGWSGFV